MAWLPDSVSLSQSQANFRLPCGQVTHPRSPSSRICAQGDAKDTSTPSHPTQATDRVPVCSVEIMGPAEWLWIKVLPSLMT